MQKLPNEDLLDFNNEKLKLSNVKITRVKSVTKTERKETVYDLKIKDNENYKVKGLGLVHNGGKRSGAGTVALPIWHNDILDFLDMQTEHGDQRMKAYDIFPQVVVPDLFMERDVEQKPWITFCPFEVKTVLGIDIAKLYGEEFKKAYLQIEEAYEQGKLKIARKHDNARAITKTIMRTQLETGLPYITFIDTINAVNPNAHNGVITNVNLCTESFSNVVPDMYGHVCNLCSINLSNIDNFDDLAAVSRLSARMLDHGIDLTNNPDEITKNHNTRYRTIGIGQMGLHDYLAKNNTNFSNLNLIREISECIEYNAVLESIELAKENIPFQAFPGSKWDTGEMTEMFKSHSNGKYNWDKAQQLINKYGIRNSQLTSPAPTTSCHSLDDEITTVTGKTNMRQIFLENGYNEDKLLMMEPQWIELKLPIEVPDTFGNTEFVTRIWWNGVENTIDIEFDDGVIYSFTPNHKLLVRENNTDTWVRCDELTIDMEIVDINMERY